LLLLVPAGAPATARHAWSTTDPAEDLVDLELSPDQNHLLVVGRQPVSGGATRTAIHWLDIASGAEQDLALLPSEVAPDIYAWSSDGRTVAFVVHTASLAAVCTLSVDGEFHYLGDLNHDGLLGPPVAPVAWAPDRRVVYGALVGQTPAATSTSPFSVEPSAGGAHAPERGPAATAEALARVTDEFESLYLGLSDAQLDVLCFHRRGNRSVRWYAAHRLAEVTFHGWDLDASLGRPPDLSTEVALLLLPTLLESSVQQSGIDWRFTTPDARIKLKRLYPAILS
jgi:hypothetical protein